VPRRRAGRPPLLEPNLTPLVDVVFLLIVFFIVVAQITTGERLDLTPPRLLDALTAQADESRRVILNVAPADQVGAVGGAYLLAGRAFGGDDDGLAALADRLAQMVARDPAIAVTVRADRLEDTARVHAALRACATAGVTRVNLVAERVEIPR